jgi:hypothetical protein
MAPALGSAEPSRAAGRNYARAAHPPNGHLVPIGPALPEWPIRRGAPGLNMPAAAAGEYSMGLAHPAKVRRRPGGEATVDALCGFVVGRAAAPAAPTEGQSRLRSAAGVTMTDVEEPG